MRSGQWSVVSGQWMAVSGQSMAVSGQSMAVSGQSMAGDFDSIFSPKSLNPRIPKSLRSSGFTLVELLVVMSIIAILSGLGAVAAYRALIHGKNTAIRMEIGQLDAALKAYKEKFGEYPPDGLPVGTMNAQDVIAQHIRKAFPRCNHFPTYLQNSPGLVNPQTALVFWLGGLPDANGVPNGFSADPTDPFDVVNIANGTTSAARIKPFYEFSSAQLINGTVAQPTVDTTGTTYKFWPRQAIGNKTSGAIVYFRATNGTYSTYATGGSYAVDGNTIRPAVDSRLGGGTVTINNSSYQIWSAGLDYTFGTITSGQGALYPSGTNYSRDIFDNITNFSRGTLEDDIP